VPGAPADDQPTAAATEAAHGRKLRNGIISMVLLVALVAGLLLAVPGLSGVARALSHVDKDTIVAALGLEFLSCVGYVLIFQRVFARAPRRFAARLAWAEMAFGAALSFGGAGSLAVGAWVLGSRGVPAGRIAERSAVLFLLTSAVNVVVLIFFGAALGLGVLPGSHDPLLSWLPAAAGTAVLGIFLAIPRWASRAAATTGRGRLATLLLGTAESIRETRRLLVTPDWRLLGAYAYLLCDIAVLYVCLDAVGAAPPLAAVVLAYQIGYMANIVPIPGGIGVLDSGLVGMLVLYGARATPATAAVLIYHAIALWVPTVFGTIAFLLLRPTLGQPIQPRALPGEAGRR
jgi:uncharacterized membrane protein YbhN (UPF0104 family)